MLPSLQYTDFHKFLVSVGGVACGVGVGIPILLLRNYSTLKITQKEFFDLNPEARDAIRIQQKQMAFMLHYWPYISATLIAAGLCFIVWGAIVWKRQQSRTDSREIAELAKIEAEREKTHQETLVLLREHRELPEVAEQVREEKEQVSDVASGTATENEVSLPQETSTNGTDLRQRGVAPTRAVPSVSSLGERTREAARKIANALASAYDNELDIVQDIRIGSAFVDAAVASRTPQISSLLVDVRVLRPLQTNVRQRVDEALAWSIRVRRAAKKELRHAFLPVVFFVVEPTETLDQQALFQTPQSDAGIVMTARAMRALEDVAGADIPLLLVVGTIDQITPEALAKIDWKSQTPRVVSLGGVSDEG